MNSFDQFSKNYIDILNTSFESFGAQADYFYAYKAHYLNRYLGSGFNGKVLDYGCGTGNLSYLIKNMFSDVECHGYDPSTQCIQAVPDQLLAKGLFVSNPSLLDQDYDVIILSCVIHHIPPEKRSLTLYRLIQRLKPLGHLIIFEHNPYNWLTRYIVEKCPLDGDAILAKPKELCYQIQDIKNIRMASIQLNYLVFMPPVLKKIAFLDRYLSWIPLGAQYAIVAQKNA